MSTDQGNKGPYPKVQGKCPSCGCESLFLGAGGYVTCSIIGGCDNPTLASDTLLGRPVPAPEPPTLARLMAEISVTATHEHAPRPSVTWDEMTESGKDLVTASMQAVIDELGLVCRDEVPTVTQVMEALGAERSTSGSGAWFMAEWHDDYATVRLLTAIGVRPDQEPDR